MKKPLALIAGFAIALSLTSGAGLPPRPGGHLADVTIASWNIRDLFSVSDVNAREDDIKAFGAAIQPDILMLQEITSLDVALGVRDSLRAGAGQNYPFVACSDFVQSDSPTRNAFEVAVISRFPFSQVLEFDPSPDNQEDDPPELPLPVLKKIGIEDVGTSRGYLWVEIEDLKLTLAVVHLKSSLGAVGTSDRDNARKRELVMAAVAAGVNEDRGFFPGYSFLVAGDFNVGHSDDKKNGTDLEIDATSPSRGLDLYDETHALLGAGLVAGLRMTNLMGHISTTTFPDFPGSPIDNIYVQTDPQSSFMPAQKGTSTFGSDHLPVFTTYTLVQR